MTLRIIPVLDFEFLVVVINNNSSSRLSIRFNNE